MIPSLLRSTLSLLTHNNYISAFLHQAIITASLYMTKPPQSASSNAVSNAQMLPKFWRRLPVLQGDISSSRQSLDCWPWPSAFANISFCDWLVQFRNGNNGHSPNRCILMLLVWMLVPLHHPFSSLCLCQLQLSVLSPLLGVPDCIWSSICLDLQQVVPSCYLEDLSRACLVCRHLWSVAIRSANRPRPKFQLSIQVVFRDSTIIHSWSLDMAQSSQSTLSKEGKHRGNTCSFQYNIICNLIHPRNGQDAAKAFHVKGMQALLLPSIGGP